MHYNFKKIGNFRLDPSLVKGWFPLEEDIFEDDDDVVKKLVILYDCYQLPFDDADGKLEKWLDDTLMKNRLEKTTGNEAVKPESAAL